MLQKSIHLAHQVWWSLFRPLTVGVRALLVDKNHVTLVRHTYQDAWYLPGGGVQKHETLEQAVRRELAEELNAVLEELQLFGVYSNFYQKKSDHIIIFTCQGFTIQPSRNKEIAEVRNFRMDNLPDHVSPGTKRRIEEYQRATAPIFGRW